MYSKTKTPKTGLAARMREWMSCRSSRFTLAQIFAALEVEPGKPRDAVRNALQDFVSRCEVVPLGPDRRCKTPVERFTYNPGWHRINKGVLNKKIYKAMRLASFLAAFSVTDITRATDASDRSYVGKVTLQLVKEGYLRIEAVRKRQPCGTERFYRVIDTDKFLLEVMK